MTDIEHQPVLLRECMEALKVRPGGVYLDATVGLGGHSEEILRRCAPDGRLIGFDRDPGALRRAAERLRDFSPRMALHRLNFAEFDRVMPGKACLDGALADLGVSSAQLLDPSRGFSIRWEGPLDMRMDPSTESALDYLKRVVPDELEVRLMEAGEERFARKLVPILKRGAEEWKTTRDLADAVAGAIPRRGRTHPATRVFLALRMAVNRELESLRGFLVKVPEYLKPGGRLAVISFHSTEDGLIKRFYSDVWRATERMRRVTKSPLIPSWEERKRNPRSRSAKLRIFEKPI